MALAQFSNIGRTAGKLLYFLNQCSGCPISEQTAGWDSQRITSEISSVIYLIRLTIYVHDVPENEAMYRLLYVNDVKLMPPHNNNYDIYQDFYDVCDRWPKDWQLDLSTTKRETTHFLTEPTQPPRPFWKDTLLPRLPTLFNTFSKPLLTSARPSVLM